jgi:hypothetical protein
MRLDLQEQVEKKGLLLGPWVSGEFGLVFTEAKFCWCLRLEDFFFCGAKQDFQELGGGV